MGRHNPEDAAPLDARRPKRPVYARLLRLRHISLGAIACFLLLEGSVGVALVLTLAGLTSWWSLLVLPVTVAAMVKLNDVVAGLLDSGGARRGRAAR